jgi:hypothetical protein
MNYAVDILRIHNYKEYTRFCLYYRNKFEVWQSQTSFFVCLVFFFITIIYVQITKLHISVIHKKRVSEFRESLTSFS